MRGFLFDNDGVLIDSSGLHWRSWQMLMEKEPPFQISYEHFLSSFGKRNDLILQELYPDESDEKRLFWADQKEELFRQIARHHISLLPGVEEFLSVLKKEGIPRIIASSTAVANLEMYLETTILGDYFDHFVSAEEVPHGKPAPDIFIEAAKRLNLRPNECIVIEDAPAGIQAGKAAGNFVVALETTHDKEALHEADLIVSDASKLHLPDLLALQI